MRVLQSSENYLETIYMLHKRKGMVRAVDIANELGFSKASVSIAMKQLRENDYVKVDEHSNISLLPKGLEIAERMYERHDVLKRGLIRLGVAEKTAEDDACKIEHVISTETFAAIKQALARAENAE